MNAPDTIAIALQWEPVIQQAYALGVRSWQAIRALMQDAGADEAVIAALRPQWDALAEDVRRAAQADGQP